MSAVEKKLEDSWPIHILVLAAAVIVLCATRVPFDNEYIYLIRLVTTYDPSFLANDVSFAAPASEHWVFNHLFGALTVLFPVEAIAWIGRVLAWASTVAGLFRLGRHWDIPKWMISLSILIWLAQGQAVLGGEWMLGGFEAKAVAYPCLLFAIDGFLRRRDVYPAVLLGLSFSFHPALGLWAIIAVGAAMLYTRRSFRGIAIVAGVTLAFSLPGIIPLIVGPTGISTPEDWHFVEVVRLPDLLDPFSWPKALIILLYLQLAFCLIALRGGGDRRRFISAFIGTLGVLFGVGMVLRYLEAWTVLQTMPTRLFPIFVALFFFYSLSSSYREAMLGPPMRWLTALALAALLLTPNPLAMANANAQLTYRTWAAPPDDDVVCFNWVRENTPKDAVFVASPWRKDFWYRAQRAQAVSSGFPTFLDLSEWRRRDEALTGESLGRTNASSPDDRTNFYHSIPEDEMRRIAAGFGADHIVTEADYGFPLLFQSGRSKVYRLR